MASFPAAEVLITPGDDVPKLRAELRARIGPAEAPMVEVDDAGRVQFVGGDWFSLVGFTKPGAAPLEALAAHTTQADELHHAIAAAIRNRASAVFSFDAGGYVKVLPIPSAIVGGRMHALVGVSATAELNRAPVVPSSARHPVVGGHLAPSKPDVAAAAPVVEQPPAAKATRPSIGERVKNRFADRSSIPALDWLVAGGVLLVALFLRLRGLDSLPVGLHEAEAITGLEAQRVIDEGSIGFYTSSAQGQPTAPFYLTAISVALFGPSAWSIRLVSALAGVAAVALVWWVVRRRFDQQVALAAAFALATMTWALHFSRIAFGVAWWPLVAFAGVAAVDRATRSGSNRDWAIAGGVVAFGLYVYNAHWFVVVAIALFLVVWAMRRLAKPDRSRSDIVGPLAGIGAGVLVLVPLLLYMQRDDTSYGSHFDQLNRRDQATWTDASFFGKVRLQLDWYIESWNGLLFNAQQDGGDATGIITMVPLVFTILAIVGLIAVLWKYRSAFTGLVLAMIAVLPLGASMATNGLTRRHYAVAPFLAVLAGIGAVVLWRVVRARAGQQVGRGLAVVLAAVMLWTGAVPYFTDFRNDSNPPWLFNEELTIVADMIQQADDTAPVYVNWYSRRHNYDFPTLAFLNDTPGENRMSLEGDLRAAPPNFDALGDATGDQLYVLVGDYADGIDELRERYPDGELVDSNDGPRVMAYRVPG